MPHLLNKNYQDVKLVKRSSNGEVKLAADSSEVNSHMSREELVNQSTLMTNGRELPDVCVSQEQPVRAFSLKDLKL